MNVIHPTGPLFTDLYELTMAAVYFEKGIDKPATFSVFIRKFPPDRGYFVAAGISDVLRELQQLRFGQSELQYLKSTGIFSDRFLDYLATMRFTGQVVAMREGTIFFPNEPIMEVTAPMIEAQILETFILNTIGFQTLIASKATRCVDAAQGRAVIDFSLRRTQGHDAGIKAARAMYIGGFSGTSNVLAGQIYDIPISGTMAHSYVMAFDSEMEAFRTYAGMFPDRTVLLIDTYDTLQGARNAVTIAREMAQQGHRLIGVRLDSGDMVTLSRQVRDILDEGGFPEVNIFASSGFDEFKIADHIQRGARIDAFGVGTKAGVSADAPYLDIVYKLVRYGDRNLRKLSTGKVTLAGEKQVFRTFHPRTGYMEDCLGIRSEAREGVPLLEPMMKNGQICQPDESIETIRNRCRQQLTALDPHIRKLKNPMVFPLKLSEELEKFQKIS